MHGIITVLNTPFLEHGGIDLGGLEKNVEIAVRSGVAGFLVNALAGEVDALTATERRLIVETVIATVRGRVPVIGGAKADIQAERIRTAVELSKLGCAGVLVNLPFEGVAQFERELQEIVGAVPGFVMLQDWDPVGPGLPVPLIVRLFETVPNFQWLKIEVIPAGPKYSVLLDATAGRLKVAGGWAVMQMIEALDRGVHAFMPTAMHVIYTRIHALYAAGDRGGAQALFERVLPVLAFSNQRLDISIQFFKRLLHAQGIYATPNVRMPCEPFDAIQARTAGELIARVCEIESDLIAGR